MKLLILITLVLLSCSCSGLRHIVYVPDPGCAARTLKKAGYGSHPKANFFQLGNTICAGDVSDRNAVACLDPWNRWCQRVK